MGTKGIFAFLQNLKILSLAGRSWELGSSLTTHAVILVKTSPPGFAMHGSLSRWLHSHAFESLEFFCQTEPPTPHLRAY